MLHWFNLNSANSSNLINLMQSWENTIVIVDVPRKMINYLDKYKFCVQHRKILCRRMLFLPHWKETFKTATTAISISNLGPGNGHPCYLCVLFTSCFEKKIWLNLKHFSQITITELIYRPVRTEFRHAAQDLVQTGNIQSQWAVFQRNHSR